MNGKTIMEIIQEMPRNDFYLNFIKGVAKTPEFSCLVVAGPAAMTKKEKETLKKAFVRAGIKPEMIATNRGLSDIAVAITIRSVTLR